MTALSLKSLLVPSKAVEVDFPGMPGFKVNVSFLSRETLQAIRKKSVKNMMKGRQVIEELDDKAFLQYYVEAAVKGWTGLKLSYVEQLAPVDLGNEKPDAELPFSSENALFLMQSSADFDAFISETVTNLSNFNKSSSSK